MKYSINDIKPYYRILLVSLLFIAAILLTAFFLNNVEQANQKHMAYDHAVKKAQIEAFQAHLLIEHILAGRKDIKIENIFDHLGIIDKYVGAMLDGGSFQNIRYFQVEDKDLRHELSALKTMSTDFRNYTFSEAVKVGNSLEDVFIDQSHNEKISAIVNQSDILEDKLQLIMKNEMAQFNVLHFLLNGILIFFGSIIILIIFNYQRRKLLDYSKIERINKSLKESEEKYRLIVESSHVGICLINTAYQLVHVNPKFAEITGYTIKELLYMDFRKLLADESLAIVTDRYLQRQRGENAENSYELIIKRKDLTYREIEIHSAILKDENKDVQTVAQVLDVTNRNEAMQKIKHLSQRLLNTQESERSNISRDMHDDIGQELTALKLNLLSINEIEQTEKQKSIINECVLKADRINKKIRNISQILRPSILDDLGLIPALRSMLNQTLTSADIKVDFYDEIKGVKFSKETEIACYRIVQESITNIARHSEAKFVSLKLQLESNKLHIYLSDNGKGFDVGKAKKAATAGKSFGILNIENRALLIDGTFEITSTIEKGTDIHVVLPC